MNPTLPHLLTIATSYFIFMTPIHPLTMTSVHILTMTLIIFLTMTHLLTMTLTQLLTMNTTELLTMVRKTGAACNNNSLTPVTEAYVCIDEPCYSKTRFIVASYRSVNFLNTGGTPCCSFCRGLIVFR